jgi:hypothetical protein
MHLPEEFLFDTVFNLRRILKPGGRLLISTPLDGPTTDPDTHRDSDGRLFNGVTPENFHFLLEKVGFHRINRWDEADTLGRKDRRWATQLFVLEGAGSRSLDQIEAILNRDKKDATYKPALFRALAELATTSYHAAVWLPEGRVAIPIGLIADKWLEYFWPLFESPIFIPQKRGEKPQCLKPVAFRAELDQLITLFRSMGGLSGFSVIFVKTKNEHRKALLKAGRSLKFHVTDLAQGAHLGRHQERRLHCPRRIGHAAAACGPASKRRHSFLTVRRYERAAASRLWSRHSTIVPVPERLLTAVFQLPIAPRSTRDSMP